MNTIAIPRRPSTSPLEASFEPFEAHLDPIEDETQTAAPKAVQFGHEVSRFQRTVGGHRDAARATIVRKILKAEDPEEHLEICLQTFLLSARPGRLDDAVDVLSETGAVLQQFVCALVAQPSASDVDEDYWYVLIRALGKSRLPSASMYIEALWLKSPEAGVEALGDLGGDESLRRLQTVAASDRSDTIRQLATEIIKECWQR